MRIMMLHYGDGDAVTMTNGVIRQLKKVTKVPYRLDLIINGGPDVAHELDAPSDYWPERAPSLAAAYNLALAVDDPDHDTIVFLHNDCLVMSGWDESMESVTATGACAFPRVTDDPNSAVGPPVPGTPPSCCWAIPRLLWLETGGFDERFKFCHFEDFDLWLRLMGMKIRLLRCRAQVFHARGFTRTREAEDANLALETNHKLYVEKWGGMAWPVIQEGIRREGDATGTALRDVRTSLLLENPTGATIES